MGRPRNATREAPDIDVAVEVSIVVDENDVARAHHRARLLQRCGLTAIGVAGGQRATDVALDLAEATGVQLLIDRTDPADPFID